MGVTDGQTDRQGRSPGDGGKAWAGGVAHRACRWCRCCRRRHLRCGSAAYRRWTRGLPPCPSTAGIQSALAPRALHNTMEGQLGRRGQPAGQLPVGPLYGGWMQTCAVQAEEGSPALACGLLTPCARHQSASKRFVSGSSSQPNRPSWRSENARSRSGPVRKFKPCPQHEPTTAGQRQWGAAWGDQLMRMGRCSSLAGRGLTAGAEVAEREEVSMSPGEEVIWPLPAQALPTS